MKAPLSVKVKPYFLFDILEIVAYEKGAFVQMESR